MFVFISANEISFIIKKRKKISQFQQANIRNPIQTTTPYCSRRIQFKKKILHWFKMSTRKKLRQSSNTTGKIRIIIKKKTSYSFPTSIFTKFS